MRLRERDWPEYLLGFLALAMIVGSVLMIMLGVQDCHAQSDCEQRGGSVEHYNFRTIYVPISCGSGCTMVVPQEVSDWRCVGATEDKR